MKSVKQKGEFDKKYEKRMTVFADESKLKKSKWSGKGEEEKNEIWIVKFKCMNEDRKIQYNISIKK